MGSQRLLILDKRVPIRDIGKIVPYSPGITHIYHVNPEKNPRGLPAYVIHASIEVVADVLESHKAEELYLRIPQKEVDYNWELKHKFNHADTETETD